MSDKQPLRRLGHSDLEVGPLAFGLWRFVGQDRRKARLLIDTALENGLNLIDTAAVYGLDWGGQAFGESETLLGQLLREDRSLRGRMVLATKFGIDPGVPYDSSPERVVESCEESLRRLHCDVIDLFQVHRPDVLTHPEDLAEVLSNLRMQGKIREAGVSNYNARQTLLLQQFLPFSLVTLQPEFSPLHPEAAFDGVLDLAMSRAITPLAWSPLAGGRLGQDASSDNEQVLRVTKLLDALAKKHDATRPAVALAFVLTHPSDPIPIIGTQNPDRIMAAADALRIRLSRSDWYAVVSASRGEPLP